jgi:hypothetical protein
MFLMFHVPIPPTLVIKMVVIALLLLKVAVSPLLVLFPPGHKPRPVLQLFTVAVVVMFDEIQLLSVGDASHVALAALTKFDARVAARTTASNTAMRKFPAANNDIVDATGTRVGDGFFMGVVEWVSTILQFTVDASNHALAEPR